MAAAVGCLAVAALTASGCGGPDQRDATPVVSKEALREHVSNQLTAAGRAPRSVTCPADLVGEVGRTASCDVVLGDGGGMRANARVTAVDGTAVAYDTTPSMTQGQLDESLRAAVRRAGSAAVDAVSCESGLAGTVGSTAFCNVTTGPTTVHQMVAVNHVDGLVMTFVVVPHIAKADLEASLQARVQQQLGQRPYAAACRDDLQGVPGSTVACDVFVGAGPRPFTLVVTTVRGEDIDYRFAPSQ
ncbi:hypothetical protein MMAD_33440 [Mycolicibacterium madagascariense]|uniref:DUF4333 domain-containing protein n=1 Tax=Mycolicibacterium madagascariense TaxID=212765 RepID=A0A7I7XIL7_9MYCO|nr:hypothetical protein MMAD_33440 [Mycolicibacterium madagascariense]